MNVTQKSFISPSVENELWLSPEFVTHAQWEQHEEVPGLSDLQSEGLPGKSHTHIGLPVYRLTFMRSKQEC